MLVRLSNLTHPRRPSLSSIIGGDVAGPLLTVSALPGGFDSSPRLLPNRILTLGLHVRFLGFSTREPHAIFPGALAAQDEDHRDQDGEHEQRYPRVQARAEDVFCRIDA